MNIFQTVVDEGASGCQFIACWTTIISPQVVSSPTVLTTFDGHSHRPHGIVPAFPIYVGGKVVNIEVEIVDVNLNYNIFLVRNWIYEMDVIVSSLFHILCFPHEGRIVIVDQMAYSLKESSASFDSTIPLVNNSKPPVESSRVRMYSLLMGTFDLPSPTARINAISSFKAPS